MSNFSKGIAQLSSFTSWLFCLATSAIMSNGLTRHLSTVTTSLLKGRPRTPYGNSIPRVVHNKLNRHQLKPGRLVLIGDVHGCNDELKLLLQKIQVSPQDNVVVCGDLVNKGPKSPEVLSTFRELGLLGIRGNHDDACLQKYHEWKDKGAALKPQHQWLSQLSPEDVQVLETLPFSLHLPNYGVLVVHAGLVPYVDLQQQHLNDVINMRNLKRAGLVVAAGAAGSAGQGQGSASAQGSSDSAAAAAAAAANADADPTPVASADGGRPRYVALEEIAEGSDAWAQFWPGPEHVFFGHDARRKLQLWQHATGLDTGAVYGGGLTAAVLPPLAHLEQSPAFSSKLASRAPLTREDLQAELVRVDSVAVHEKPGSKAE